MIRLVRWLLSHVDLRRLVSSESRRIEAETQVPQQLKDIDDEEVTLTSVVREKR